MPHVLIVDDEPRMLELLKLYIQPYGYTCQLVDSAQQALDLCRQRVFDLILLDVMMPDMDGWTCCRLIREHSNIPILMVTARNQLTTMLWGAEAAVDERTIDSHIRHLREKLRVCGFPIEQHLETVRGIGYRWTHQ